MRVYNFIKRLFSKRDVLSKLKEKSGNFIKIIKKESELIGESMYFKLISASDWQVIDTLKTQLAHGILSNKLSFEEASISNYVFDLIRLSWVDAGGDLVITNEEEFESLANGEISPSYVNELSRLALEANGFLVNSDDLKKK